MFDFLAKSFVYVLELYLVLGLIFAVPLVLLGVHHVDSEAQGAGIAFRLLIIPGVAAFWPMFMRRWLRGISEPAVEKNPHRTQQKQ